MMDSNAASGTDEHPLVWLTTISITVNLIVAAVWVLETWQEWRQNRAVAGKLPNSESRVNAGKRNNAIVAHNKTGLWQETDEAEKRQSSMYKLVDLVLSQILALYSLCLLLALPLIQQSFQQPTPTVKRFMGPALCVAIGKHVFFSVRGWRVDRGHVNSLTHAVSAVCYLMFMRTETTLVLAALWLATELGNVYTQLEAVIGERHASRLPVWIGGLGVILSITFNGVVYLLVLAMALARKSPMSMSPLAVSVFFFFITYSFFMKACSIYFVVAGFFGKLLDANLAYMLSGVQSKRDEDGQTGTGGEHVPEQALSNIKTALFLEGGMHSIKKSTEKEQKSDDGISSADRALLMMNVV